MTSSPRIAPLMVGIAVLLLISIPWYINWPLIPEPEAPISLAPAQGSEPEGTLGNTITLLLYPNATELALLTINEPYQASLAISGTAQDLLVSFGGLPALTATGTLRGTTYDIQAAGILRATLEDTLLEDRTGNTIPDTYERRHAILTLKHAPASDPDRDTLSFADEYAYFAKTKREINPFVRDTDGDGISDGEEVQIGTNPIDPRDKPSHGFAKEPWFFPFNDLFSHEHLIALWSFDAQGMDARSNHPLTLLENTTLAPGLFGNALNVTFSSSGARGKPSTTFNRLDAFTLSAWVVTNDNRSRSIITIASQPPPDTEIQQRNASLTIKGPAGIAMDFGSSKPSCRISARSVSIEAKTRRWRVLADHFPHQIACVKNATSLSLYIDGVLDESVPAFPRQPDAAGPLTIGAVSEPTPHQPHPIISPPLNDGFSGVIDNILLYDTALSSEAIAEGYMRMQEGIDQDADGMGDDWEERHSLSPRVASDSRRDDDQDGLTNLQEFQYFLLTGRELDPKRSDTDGDQHTDLAEVHQASNPVDATDTPSGSMDTSADVNADGIPDYWELAFGLPITEPIADQDPDADGLSTLQEYRYFSSTGRLTSPMEKDTDADGITDMEELMKGTDPTTVLQETLHPELPARLLIEIPSYAILTRAALTVNTTINLTPLPAIPSAVNPQNKVQPWSTGEQPNDQYQAKDSVDISRILTTDCAFAHCRNSFIITGDASATISAIDIRYQLQPRIPDPLPLCPAYPCTFPITLKSRTPGNITLTLTNATPCTQACQNTARLRCPHDISCTAAGKKYSSNNAPALTGFTISDHDAEQPSTHRALGFFLLVISAAALIGGSAGYIAHKHL